MCTISLSELPTEHYVVTLLLLETCMLEGNYRAWREGQEIGGAEGSQERGEEGR